MMNIFIYAMQMEKDGEDFYYQLAQQTPNKGLRTILEMLATEEAKHYKAIEEMRSARPELAETTVLSDAKNVFAQIKESKESFDFDLGQIELYKKAQELEQKSMGFYSEKAHEVEEEHQKEIFLKLAAEEKKHYFLLENIIEYVSRPKMWLENAEFCHLDEY
ncbi:MAG: ferritin family protein [Phycisphaerae bacterium]|nr:ferritin family protein [Phycisphaerae bacterium]